MIVSRLAVAARLACLVLTASASAAGAAPLPALKSPAPYSRIAETFQSCTQACRRTFDRCMDRVDPRYCEARLEPCMAKCESRFISR
jgi:hypothetical protein